MRSSASVAAAVPHAPVNTKLVRRDLLYRDADQPRKRVDPDELQELAKSIAPPTGIINAIVVHPADKDGRYKIIAGERRWRAAEMVGYEDVPVTIRDASDLEVAITQLVENHQRANVHPVEEAEGIERILKLDKTQTPKTIADSIGMSERYVQNRLRYRTLIAGARDAFYDNAISAGHADLLIRLEPDVQKKALAACFRETFWDEENPTTGVVELDEDETPKKQKVLVSVRELDKWIKRNVRISLEPKAREMDFFPSVAEAVAAAKVRDAPRLLEVTTSYEYWGKEKPAPLTRDAWVPVEKKKVCPHQQRAVVVLGTGYGDVLTVCTRDSECEVHWPKPKETRASAHGRRKANKARIEKEAAQRKLRDKVMAAAIKKVKGLSSTLTKPTPAALALIAYEMRCAASWPAVVSSAVDSFSYRVAGAAEYRKVGKLLKPLGVDFVTLENELAPKPVKTPGVQRAEKSVAKAQARLATKKKIARKAGAKK